MKETSLLVALGLALSITIVYLLIVWILDLPSGVDVIYYYLLFPFLVFGGTVLLYYIFMYFKQEDKLFWFFISGGIVLFLTFYSSGFMEMDLFAKNSLNFSKPLKDDSNYQDINSADVLIDGQHLIKAQFSSDQPIKTWFTPADELIIITEQVSGNSHAEIYEGSVTCFKLNTDGDTVDSLAYVHNRKAG